MRAPERGSDYLSSSLLFTLNGREFTFISDFSVETTRTTTLKEITKKK
jgi:hypothetical protein